jgi:hypothetical protein
VVDAVAEFEEAGFAEEASGRPPAWWRPEQRGLQWDHDPLANVVLYNEQALVVIDRNGGRITHLFAMVAGRPCSVSGTHKAYQFLDLEWTADSGTECDGIVLQNTVWTPNHGHVACDVDASRGTVGVSPSGDAVFDWYYPDNFNLYDEVDDPGSGAAAVTFEYGPASHDGEPPATIATLEEALAADRAEKVAGRRGTVYHDVAEFGAFRKTIRLDGKTLHVAYSDSRPGHRVANEFCVDLEAAALRGARQRVVVDPDRASATITNAGLVVRIDQLRGCEFSEAPHGPLVPPTADALRLHRVMTDDLEIVAPDGGAFAYRITLP